MSTIIQKFKSDMQYELNEVIQSLATRFNFDVADALRFINSEKGEARTVSLKKSKKPKKSAEEKAAVRVEKEKAKAAKLAEKADAKEAKLVEKEAKKAAKLAEKEAKKAEKAATKAASHKTDGVSIEKLIAEISENNDKEKPSAESHTKLEEQIAVLDIDDASSVSSMDSLSDD